MQPRIFITGGSGFIGTNLVDHYAGKDVAVMNFDLRLPANPDHAPLWRSGTLLAKDDLTSAVQAFNPTHLFHLAARTDLDGPTVDDYPDNTIGVRNLIEAAATLPELQRVIFASSRLVCRIGYQPANDTDYRPSTAYGASKVQGEELVRTRCPGARYNWILVRPTSLWGPWFNVPYRNFFEAVARGRYLHPAGRRIHKSFGYVGNSVHQLDRLMFGSADVAGRTFYLCDYEPLEVRQWAEAIRTAFGAPPVREVPTPLLRAAALAGDVLKRVGVRNPPLTSFRLNNLMTEMVHDAAPLRRSCGPLPYTVEEGIDRTVAWMRTHAWRPS